MFWIGFCVLVAAITIGILAVYVFMGVQALLEISHQCKRHNAYMDLMLKQNQKTTTDGTPAVLNQMQRDIKAYINYQMRTGDEVRFKPDTPTEKIVVPAPFTNAYMDEPL